jgi:hypothetical protein
MSRTLFTVFHANLDFSALPDEDVPLVLERCYWPLLRLAAEDHLPIGIEMPARTLERVVREDPEWVKTLRLLCEQGRVEFVGSGFAQIAAPLAPADVNRANLAFGRAAYERCLGAAPVTWFVHEQTFSQGLVPQWAAIGARQVVMEWNNPATHRHELRDLRWRPARLAMPDGSAGPGLLWNDSAVFQKMQRVAHGQAPLAEYLAFVRRAAHGGVACAYGGDLEIFDYRPGHPAPSGAERGVETTRLREALLAIARDDDNRLVLPRDAAALHASGPLVELAAPTEPIPCKKQPRYNPTRWAVSGRDAIGLNTRCHALRRKLAAAIALGCDPADAAEGLRDLVSLWRSDLRTRATDEKLAEFHERAGRLGARLRDRIERTAPPLPPGADVVLLNASNEAWNGEIVEIELRLPPGRLRDGAVRAIPTDVLAEGAAQLEVRERHRDGSVRRARLVVAPCLVPGATLALELVSRGAPTPRETPIASAERLATEAVDAALLPLRGASLGALRFPTLSPRPLVGTIGHGRFDHAAFTPDFYSAHAVAVTEQGEKVADLARTSDTITRPNGPLRASVTATTRTALGEWRKTYHAYRDRARLDVVHELHLREVRLQSLRIATLTWMPDAFRRDSLRFAAVNGGDVLETFTIPRGAKIEHPRSAAPSVSATSCLGATEGFVSAGDDRLGVAILGDRAQAALVPLLEFHDVDDEYLLRVHHTAAETDETRATFFRGVLRFAVAIVGHRADAIGEVRRTAGALARGLVFRTEHAVGIAGGL